MWEFECHEWDALQWNEKPKTPAVVVRQLLGCILVSSDEEERKNALGLLEYYASDEGIPSEATSHVVACLVAIVACTDGQKRLAVLDLLEELTCGRWIEEYSPQKVTWLQQAVSELACALHTWACLAENSSAEEAVLAVYLLGNCARHVPHVEAKASRYLQLCAARRPELKEEISALLERSNQVKAVLREKSRP